MFKTNENKTNELTRSPEIQTEIDEHAQAFKKIQNYAALYKDCLVKAKKHQPGNESSANSCQSEHNQFYLAILNQESIQKKLFEKLDNDLIKQKKIFEEILLSDVEQIINKKQYACSSETIALKKKLENSMHDYHVNKYGMLLEKYFILRDLMINLQSQDHSAHFEEHRNVIAELAEKSIPLIKETSAYYETHVEKQAAAANHHFFSLFTARNQPKLCIKPFVKMREVEYYNLKLFCPEKNKHHTEVGQTQINEPPASTPNKV